MRRSPKLDGFGRVLKSGSKSVDYAKTASIYGTYYDAGKLNFKGRKTKAQQQEIQSNKAKLSKFVKYFAFQAEAGRVPVRLTKANAEFAAKFGSIPPAGSKITFLPKRFAGKKITFEDGVPTITGKTTVSKVYFLDFVTDEFMSEIDDAIENGNWDEVESVIEHEVSKFVRRMPDGATFSLTLASGDYAKGSTYGKAKLGEFLTDLLLRYSRSKGGSGLADFVVAINAITPK